MQSDRTTSQSISCPSCARRYAWRPQLAGRKVRCRCGHVMVAPQEARAPHESLGGDDPPAGDELYDFAPATTPPPPQRAISSTAPPAASPAPRAVEYQRPDVQSARVDAYFPDRVKDLYMPLALIAGGTVIEFALSLFGGRSSGMQGAARAVGYVGIYMVINTIIMLAAIFLVAKMRGISFGPLPTAVLKLCAISIGPGAIGSLVGALLWWFPFGGLIGWVVGFILYFALIGALFDLDEPDTWWCVITIFGVKLLVAVVIVGYVLRGL